MSASAPSAYTTRDDLIGRRVRLERCDDDYTHLAPGADGVIILVDDAGTVHVDWDSGARVGLVPGAGDRFTLLPEGEGLTVGPIVGAKLSKEHRCVFASSVAER